MKTGGLTLKSNTRYLAHVTDNSGSFYFNATEARGSGVIVPLWKSDTNGGSYAIDDIINYSGVLYKNLTGINLDTLPNADTTNWKPTVIDENDGISAKDLLVLDGNGLAIGGVITTDGAHTVHTFTTSGTFVPNGNTNIEYLIVGGGGSAGTLRPIFRKTRAQATTCALSQPPQDLYDHRTLLRHTEHQG